MLHPDRVPFSFLFGVEMQELTHRDPLALGLGLARSHPEVLHRDLNILTLHSLISQRAKEKRGCRKSLSFSQLLL